MVSQRGNTTILVRRASQRPTGQAPIRFEPVQYALRPYSSCKARTTTQSQCQDVVYPDEERSECCDSSNKFADHSQLKLSDVRSGRTIICDSPDCYPVCVTGQTTNAIIIRPADLLTSVFEIAFTRPYDSRETRNDDCRCMSAMLDTLRWRTSHQEPTNVTEKRL